MLIYSINTKVKDDLFTDTTSNPSPGSYVHSSQPNSQVIPRNMINISSDSNNNKSNNSNSKPSKNKELFVKKVKLKSFSKNDKNSKADQSEFSNKDFPDINTLLSQQKTLIPTPTAPSSSRPTRTRKTTVKQASQNRRAIEKQLKRKAKLAKKPKTINTTQLDDVELPFRSSQ
jgi:hypothetical protein